MNFVSNTATLGIEVFLGHFIVIDDLVKIGNNCIIGNNVVIHKGSKIGDNVRIDDNAVIGKQPIRSVNSIFKGEMNYEGTVISNNCLIGTGVIIYCGCIIGSNTLVADLATIREQVTIGEKTIIGRGVAIENLSSVGSFCKIETNAYITAYSEIQDYAFIAPGVVTSNDNYAGRSEKRYKFFKGITVKRGGRIGANATILPGKIINEDGFVGAGSVVTKDVEKESVVSGNPAKYLRNVQEDQLLRNQ